MLGFRERGRFSCSFLAGRFAEDHGRRFPAAMICSGAEIKRAGGRGSRRAATSAERGTEGAIKIFDSRGGPEAESGVRGSPEPRGGAARREAP